MKLISDFQKYKESSKKISMVTCYDAWSARVVEQSEMDCILVGDSVAMVVHGFDSTIPATTQMIATHVAAVRRGAPTKIIIGDMPFLSVRRGLQAAMEDVQAIMQAGATCVKIEGVDGHESIIKHIVESGVPVMGHIGLTPQSVHQLGGFKVQGKSMSEAQKILDQAKKLQELGAFAVVLECIPNGLAEEITQSITIPTIGIGAGQRVDGQVLVMQDLLGMNIYFKPKFLRTYLDGFSAFKGSLNQFNQDVKTLSFPSLEESYDL
ncbi:MAG: 3-methyl-2-oxobutanoate hydroxymethyltransferase [Bdellovibrionales bacterium]|nr:3-methyl-2-oxobutanoate hydroxymethyltransferase [Bdellovibrionales bacterium]